MKVLVARHAETNYNLQNLCNGDPRVNVYLTPKGLSQAKILAKSLQRTPIDLIITSQFHRTKETAEIVNKYHNVPVIEDKRINDVVTGFEGENVSKFLAARNSAKNRWTVRINDGESYEDLKLRVLDFLEELKNKKEKSVLIVTHQVIAKIIFAYHKGLANEDVEKIVISNVHCFEINL